MYFVRKNNENNVIAQLNKTIAIKPPKLFSAKDLIRIYFLSYTFLPTTK